MHYLAAFLAFLPAVIAAPTYSNSSCHTSAKSIILSITDLYFRSSQVYSTPAHQVASGSISFNVTNTVTGITIPCSASSSQLYNFFNGDTWYHCPKVDGVDDTEFIYDRKTGAINLIQNWTCRDAPMPFGYIAAGGGSATVDCKTEEYQNQNWRLGAGVFASNTTECNKADIAIAAQISKVVL